MQADALTAALIAFATAALLTPVAARAARRLGFIDPLSDRGLARGQTPLLGGLAILAGAELSGWLFLPDTTRWHGILAAAALISLVGVVDDRRDLPPGAKLVGQIIAGLVLVEAGVVVHAFTVPIAGRVGLGDLGGPLTLVGLVAVMNVVNFSDGVDGLAAGLCAIVAAAFAVIAFDLHRDSAGVLSALTAGAALGFLLHNFYPASVFMGDSGSNLLGLLLGAVIVEGSLKTQALVALVLPLLVLTVPFLDTTFVVLKRLKYRRPPYRADAEHFHHRFNRIGFSQRRTVLYLYGWTLVMAGLALGVRFIPYSDRHGNLHTGWTLVMVACFGFAFAASVYLVYVLEILKFKRLRAREAPPGTAEHLIDAQVSRELDTGEFRSLPG